MPKIAIRKCPFTKQYFEDDKAYAKHLKKLRRTQTEDRRFTIAKRTAKESVMSKMLVARTFREVEQIASEEIKNILRSYHGLDLFKCIEKVEMIEFKFESLRYSDRVSNSHSCPRGGQTNWGGRVEGAPRGYPGFSGSVEYRYFEPKLPRSGFGLRVNEAFKQVGIHTGTGGGRGTDTERPHYRYGVELFLDDFPGIAQHIKDMIEKRRYDSFEQKLRGVPIPAISYEEIIG